MSSSRVALMGRTVLAGSIAGCMISSITHRGEMRVKAEEFSLDPQDLMAADPLAAGSAPGTPGLTPPQRTPGSPRLAVGRPEDWRKYVDDMFNDQNLVRGAEFGTHLQVQPPPKNTTLALGLAFASDQFPEQHGVHFQFNTNIKGNQLVGTANPTMGEYRAIWSRELLSDFRTNVMLAVTDDGQHDTGHFTFHYVPLQNWSAMMKIKASAAQPTSTEIHYLQAVTPAIALGASLTHSHKQETKSNIFGRYVTRTRDSLEQIGDQDRFLLREESFYAALPWPVLELHYLRRWRSPSPMQFPGTDFAFATELRMHVPNRDAVAKFAVMTNMQTFKFQAAMDSKQRLTAQLSSVVSEQMQMKLAAEFNHAENTSQFGFSFDCPLF